MSSDAVVIVAAKRTPIGAFQGALSGATAPQLGAAAIKGAVDASGIDAADIDRVMMGCVLPAGLGQAPARQAALGAGVPEGVPCVTVNKMCGSGMEAIILAHDMIKAGSAGIVVAGGLESMSNAPYLLPKARSGYRMGHQEVLDHMFFDGLQDPYDGEMMGHFAQVTADKYGFSREEMDAFAIESVRGRSGLSPTGRLPAKSPRSRSSRAAAKRSSTRTRRRERSASTRFRHCARRLQKTAPLPPQHPRRFPTARQQSDDDGSRSRQTRPDADCQNRRPLRVCARAGVVHNGARLRIEETASMHRAGRPTTSTSMKSMRPSPSSRWRR